MNWRRTIVAVLIGLLATFALMITVGSWTLFPPVIRQYWPPFFGALVAGFLARRWGWLLGFLVAGILEVCLLFFNLWAFSWADGPHAVLDIWFFQSWGLILLTLLAGVVGGFLGEKLAHKVSKK